MWHLLELVEVPFNSAGHAKGVARMPSSLRFAGLIHRLSASRTWLHRPSSSTS